MPGSGTGPPAASAGAPAWFPLGRDGRGDHGALRLLPLQRRVAHASVGQVNAPVPDAAIVEPADALIRVTRASILGKIDSGLEALNVPGSARATIELLK